MTIAQAIQMRPVHVAILTPTAEVAFDHHASLIAVSHQHRPIVIDTVILIVPAKLRIEGLPHLADGDIKLTRKPTTQFQKLLAILLPRCLPFQFELTGATAPTIVSESQGSRKFPESLRRHAWNRVWQSDRIEVTSSSPQRH